jgi:hypothetical protein
MSVFPVLPRANILTVDIVVDARGHGRFQRLCTFSAKATRVSRADRGRWFADLSPVDGPVLGPFKLQSKALEAEVDWFRLHVLHQINSQDVLVLPQPQVTSPRLDHERSKVLAVLQSGLWQIAPGGEQTSGDVINRGYHDAQRFVTAACNDPAFIARSRQQAEQVLGTFFKAMGWKVSVQWAD